MNLKDVKKVAREKMKGFCNVCKECNGVWCAGMVPGMGGAGSAHSFKHAYEELKKVRLIMRTIHSAIDPNTEFTLFGESLAMPIITAPITGTKFNMGGGVSEEEYASDVVHGSIEAGTIAMIGDTGDATCFEYGLKAVREAKGHGIAIIKPRDNSEIIKRIRMAEEAGCVAVGMDIDGAGLVTMKLFGQPVGPKSIEDIRELVASTELPFIVKGILSADEARACVEAGVSAIVVSNHGGRVLNNTLAPAETLEEIVEAVGDKITVLADGCVREGGDVLKYLALGARGVLVGRPVIWGSIGGRQDGVKLTLETLKNQLYQNMILTGCSDVSSVSRDRVKY